MKYLAVVATFAVTACLDADDATYVAEPDPTLARFADASDQELQRAIDAVLIEPTLAVTTALAWAAFEGPGTCPEVTRRDNVTSVTTLLGCTLDETPLDGSVVVRNVWPEFGGSGTTAEPMEISFYHFVVGTDPGSYGYNGDLVFERERDATRVFAGIGVQDGEAPATHLTLGYRTLANFAEAEDASTIKIDGFGRATIKGSWSVVPLAGGTLVLEGADQLAVDLTPRPNGCLRYAIDGADAGQLCP